MGVPMSPPAPTATAALAAGRNVLASDEGDALPKPSGEISLAARRLGKLALASPGGAAGVHASQIEAAMALTSLFSASPSESGSSCSSPRDRPTIRYGEADKAAATAAAVAAATAASSAAAAIVAAAVAAVDGLATKRYVPSPGAASGAAGGMLQPPPSFPSALPTDITNRASGALRAPPPWPHHTDSPCPHTEPRPAPSKGAPVPVLCDLAHHRTLALPPRPPLTALVALRPTDPTHKRDRSACSLLLAANDCSLAKAPRHEPPPANHQRSPAGCAAAAGGSVFTPHVASFPPARTLCGGGPAPAPAPPRGAGVLGLQPPTATRVIARPGAPQPPSPSEAGPQAALLRRPPHPAQPPMPPPEQGWQPQSAMMRCYAAW